VRRNLGRVTVAKELVRNEEGRGLFILGEQELPLLDLSKCQIISKSENLKEGGALLGLGFWYSEWGMSCHPLAKSKGEVEALGGRTRGERAHTL
jgi:hypothetical protein